MYLKFDIIWLFSQAKNFGCQNRHPILPKNLTQGGRFYTILDTRLVKLGQSCEVDISMLIENLKTIWYFQKNLNSKKFPLFC